MPSTVFSVDVNDEAFTRFKKHFDGYTAAVNKLPGAWRAVNKAAQEGIKANEKLVSAIDKGVARMGSLSRVARGFSGDMLRAERAMVGMTMSTGKIAGNLVNAAYSFAKVSGLMTLGAGLLGGGSLWGIAGLASNAANLRRSTQGYSLGPGELRAYQTNYSRFADPGAVLGNVADARNDPSKQWAFSAMGVPDWQSRSTADLATSLPALAKRIFAEGGQNTQYAEARGLTQFFSVEDLRRLHEMTEAEIDAAGRRFAIDRRQMAVSDDVTRRWQNFSVQLDRSGNAIESTFITALGPLAPELEKLSDAFTDAVKNVMSTEKMREVVDAVAGGIRVAGDYISSGRFANDLKDFGAGLREMWEALRRVAGWVNGWLGGSAGSGGIAPPGQIGSSTWWHNDRRTAFSHGWSPTGGSAPAWGLGSAPGTDLLSGLDPQGWIGDSRATTMAAIERQRGLPAGLLDGVWSIESRRGSAMGPSSRGARGHFQFLRSTGAQWGLNTDADFEDFGKSSRAAGGYLEYLTNYFGGDLRKGVASYNYGMGNVENLVRARGQGWEAGLPAETQNYLARLAHLLPPRVDIRVENQTGGQITVQQTGTVAQ